MNSKRIKFPYGISNFERLVRDGYYFVDKTKYIEMIEESDETRPQYIKCTILK